eukprot:scaffold32025_cov30-Phaeocystis_antarctica.AAC.3
MHCASDARGRQLGSTWGCSLHHMGLQPLPDGVAASITWGCSLFPIVLQPPSHGVAGAAVPWRRARGSKRVTAGRVEAPGEG